MKVLLTNDDGIEAEGLQALRRALAGVDGIELVTIAPDGNRSAMARMITTRRPLWVQETPFEDGTVGFATDGTPVDCVRFATLGLVDGFTPDLIVVGDQPRLEPRRRHHLLGHRRRGLRGARARRARRSPSRSSRQTARWTSASGAASTSRPPRSSSRGVVDELDDVPLPDGTLLNINVPGDHPVGVEVTRLGKRIYRDELQLETDAGSGKRRYWIYGADPGFHDEPGTDLAAVAEGRISVTPVHFDLTDVAGIDALAAHDLTRLLAPAARELG